jgi:hypothetical protein
VLQKDLPNWFERLGLQGFQCGGQHPEKNTFQLQKLSWTIPRKPHEENILAVRLSKVFHQVISGHHNCARSRHERIAITEHEW